MTTQTLSFSQLPQKAKDVAVGHYAENLVPDFWNDAVYEDAKQIASLMGIEIDKIYYSGFSSQGDGACFTGNFSYKSKALHDVKQYAPLDIELHKIAKNYTDIQRKAFYKLKGKVVHSGPYYHSNSNDITVEHSDDIYRDIGDLEKEMKDVLRSFMDWIYRELEDSYNFEISEEAASQYYEDENVNFDEYGNIGK